MAKRSEILIVDDTPEHIALAGAMLRGEGYRVYAVTGGEAALTFLQKVRPDLVMLDVRMEPLGGFEVCRRMKRDPQLAGIPVIFLTADHSPESIAQGFSLGGSDYVVKPFLREELLARVQTQLQIARQSRELKDAYQELDQFCSAVSHDLRSPLAVMRMLIDQLAEEPQNAMLMQMLSDKAGEMSKMIERLLEFSRMCNIQPQLRPLDLNRMIPAIFRELYALEPDRKIRLEMETLPEIQGDEILIGMLLKNLLANAVKFTRTRVEAVITVSQTADATETVISIRDNGVGFDEAYADKLFQVFQRLHDASEFEGTGVGLALAARIMQRHGGTITASGTLGHGAVFELHFQR